MIKEVNENHRPIIITEDGIAKAAFIDIETYEKQLDTLKMLKVIALGEQAIKNGELVNQDDFFKEMEKELK